MNARSIAIAFFAWCAAGALAADVEVHGRVYGSVTDDFAEGTVGPMAIPEAPGEGTLADDITEDGDPTYNFRFRADVGIRAAFDERVAANLNFTLDDRKQSKFYRYGLFESSAGVYHLAESVENRYVYASLEEVNVELAEMAWDTDLTLGGYDVRYGRGGYYNALVNRIDPTSFVAYLDPFGARATREFGPAAVSLGVGAGLDRQAIAAAACRVGVFGLFAASEGRTYDLKSLWDTHYAPGLPKFWRQLYWREHALAPEARGAPGTLGDTIHAGAEAAWDWEFMDLYAVAAYHVFADDAEYQSPTGGELIQFYPDFGIRLFWPRLWFRGAVLYEAWRANYHSAFADGVNINDSLLMFGEPEFFLAENLFVGVGGRYLNPSRQVPDNPDSKVREDITLSIAAVPHLSYAPAENVKIDLSYAETWWDPSYDLKSTDYEENRAHDLKLEIEAAF
jgi:hypothetical protein